MKKYKWRGAKWEETKKMNGSCFLLCNPKRMANNVWKIFWIKYLCWSYTTKVIKWHKVKSSVAIWYLNIIIRQLFDIYFWNAQIDEKDAWGRTFVNVNSMAKMWSVKMPISLNCISTWTHTYTNKLTNELPGIDW